MSRNHKTALVVLALVAGMHVALVLAQRLYPFVDLPNHLAAATIYRYYDAPTNEFDQYYTVDLFPAPNVFHILFLGSRVFPSVDVASKVFYGLYVVLLPLSVLLLIRRLGGSPWFAILSFVLLYNYNVSWGFMGFTASIPAVLLTYGFALRSSRSGRIQNQLLTMGSFVVLFFVHVLAALFAAMVFLLYVMDRHKKQWRQALQEATVLLPLGLAIFGWWIGAGESSGPPTRGFLSYYYQIEYFDTFRERFQVLFFDHYALGAGSVGVRLGVFFSICLLVPFLVWCVRNPKAFWRSDPGVGVAPARALFLGSLLACLLLPGYLPGQAILYQRFSVFLWLACIVLGSVVFSRQKWKLQVVVFSFLVLGHFGLWWQYFDDFRKENQVFDRSLFPEPEPGARLSALIWEYRYRGQPIYLHFQNYYIIWKQGTAATRVMDYRFGVIGRLASLESLPVYDVWVGLKDDYDGRYSDLEYLLVRGRSRDHEQDRVAGFSEVVSRASWSLFEREGGAGDNRDVLLRRLPGRPILRSAP